MKEESPTPLRLEEDEVAFNSRLAQRNEAYRERYEDINLNDEDVQKYLFNIILGVANAMFYNHKADDPSPHEISLLLFSRIIVHQNRELMVSLFILEDLNGDPDQTEEAYVPASDTMRLLADPLGDLAEEMSTIGIKSEEMSAVGIKSEDAYTIKSEEMNTTRIKSEDAEW